MTGRLVDLSFSLNSRQRVTIELEPGQDFRETFDQLKDSVLDVEIKKHRKKRSIDANNFLWKLLDLLADKLHTTKDELYLLKIKEVGVYRDFTLNPDEAKTFCVVWQHMGKGWPTEQVDFSPDGEKVVIRAYYGSSTYNTKQMGRLLDSVIEDCKEQGISVISEREISLLKEGWGKDEVSR